MIRDMLQAPLPDALSEALKARGPIFDMIDQAERAVLSPVEPGGIPHDMRHALAARIAHLGGREDLAARYGAGLDAGLTRIAQGAADDTPIVRFMDRVATQTRDVTDQDVADLTAAGVDEADVVRLCELNAFVSFQLRLLGGLRLMEASA